MLLARFILLNSFLLSNSII